MNEKLHKKYTRELKIEVEIEGSVDLSTGNK